MAHSSPVRLEAAQPPMMTNQGRSDNLADNLKLLGHKIGKIKTDDKTIPHSHQKVRRLSLTKLTSLKVPTKLSARTKILPQNHCHQINNLKMKRTVRQFYLTFSLMEMSTRALIRTKTLWDHHYLVKRHTEPQILKGGNPKEVA